MRAREVLLLSLLAGSACGMVAMAAPAESGEADAAEGREVFKRKNCQHCHAVTALGIERTSSSPKMRGPDLSDVGLRYTAEQLRELLRKGAKVAGRRHWKPFWGNGEDLAALVAWLSTLRLPPVPEDSPSP